MTESANGSLKASHWAALEAPCLSETRKVSVA